jgi:hypothetical protein
VKHYWIIIVVSIAFPSSNKKYCGEIDEYMCINSPSNLHKFRLKGIIPGKKPPRSASPASHASVQDLE